jgi:hypothetical protein
VQCSVQCAVCSVQCAVQWNVQCSGQWTVQCAVCSVPLLRGEEQLGADPGVQCTVGALTCCGVPRQYSEPPPQLSPPRPVGSGLNVDVM